MIELAEYTWLLPGLAVGLDLLLGDPRWLPHPVRLIGCMADRFEVLAWSVCDGTPGRIAGFFSALALVALVSVVVYFSTSFGPFAFFVSLYLCYAGLALRCLLSEAKYVNRLLNAGQLTEARVALSMLVSRDTSKMNAGDMRRSLAETVSENLNDGFVAPLFWLCLAGPLGMWVSKTISTLDSMWGYKTEKYRDFGWFAAKADDCLAWIPARLTALSMYVTGLFMQLGSLRTLRYAFRDARIMESPNAGYPMAAAAWLVGAQMGGPTIYHGQIKAKPVLGPKGKPWTSKGFTALYRLTRWSAVGLALVFQAALALLVFS